MKKVSILIFVFFYAFIANAQFREVISFNNGGMLSVNWNISSPSGEMKNMVEKTALSGISVDYRHCYKQNIILGARFGWNKFYEDKGLTLIQNGTTNNYIKQQNTVNASPVFLVVDYMFASQKFIPYAGIGVGGVFVNTKSVTSVGSSAVNSFHFGFSPEVGITIPTIITNFGFNFSTRYNWVLKTSKTDNFSWFDFNIGVAFMY